MLRTLSLVAFGVTDESNSMPKVGDVVAGKYTIEQLIGLGGMGAVFAAEHRFTGKRVALKWMLPELATDNDAVARFLREAHAAGRINHANVVDVYDVGREAEAYFLVMEYLQGEPLTSALARRDMTATELLALLIPAMRGVAAAHRQGVVHRDLKPDNIFLAYDQDGTDRQAKVLDFGISKLSNEGTLDARLTKTGAVVGTPYYMSPEQIRGSTSLDKRADVYAFGVILYEALTGQVPFHAETYGALILEIATATPTPPRELAPSVSPELSRIVLRAMARDPAQRYPDMESLIAALEPHVRGSTGLHSAIRNPLGSSQLAVPLDETRLDTPQPHVPTVARLASTPFAFEAPEASQKPKLPGWALFGLAAVTVVGGVWFFTRPAEVPTNIVAPAPRVPPTTQHVSAPPVQAPSANTGLPSSTVLPSSPTPSATTTLPAPPYEAPAPPVFTKPQTAMNNGASQTSGHDALNNKRPQSRYSAAAPRTIREHRPRSATVDPEGASDALTPTTSRSQHTRFRTTQMSEDEFIGP